MLNNQLTRAPEKPEGLAQPIGWLGALTPRDPQYTNRTAVVFFIKVRPSLFGTYLISIVNRQLSFVLGCRTKRLRRCTTILHKTWVYLPQ